MYSRFPRSLNAKRITQVDVQVPPFDFGPPNSVCEYQEGLFILREKEAGNRNGITGFPCSLPLPMDSLSDWFQPFDSCVVAFSGGLDSSVVAKAAALTLGEAAEAVMAYSASSLCSEVDAARTVAEAIPIRFQAFPSFEMDDEAYVANDRERCYHCKKIRFAALCRYAVERGRQIVVDGSHADDLNDYRPGRRAVLEFGVRSPLLELGLTKVQVRELARFWKLPNSEKPAAPCLSTRLAYGLRITEERLRQVEAAEEYLRNWGFSPFRVRLHTDDLARIEVAPDQLSRLAEPDLRATIVEKFQRLGFRFVSVDLQGFRSGSMDGRMGNGELRVKS